jgi:hypothetical protein
MLRRAVFGILIIVAVLLVIIPQTRTWMLRRAGWALVVDDPLAPADAIVLTVDAGEPGVVEANRLVAAGLSQHVAFFVAPHWQVDEDLARRGVAVDQYGTRLMQALLAEGFADVAPMPTAVSGSRDEGAALAQWSVDHRINSVIVVAPPDHTRRLRRVLRRSMKDVPSRVIVRATRRAAFHPDRWWQTREGVRTQITETAKLLIDVLRHPWS